MKSNLKHEAFARQTGIPMLKQGIERKIGSVIEEADGE